jgi:phage head maturation protease
MGAISRKDRGGDTGDKHMVVVDGVEYEFSGTSLMHDDSGKPMRKPDFSGWATKAGIECSDGRTIMPNAFKHQDNVTVPLVWSHGHKEPTNILGHAILEHHDEGVYTYGYFNGTPQGENAKALVAHGDITYLSIFANKLAENNRQVAHGQIREVSLVMAGANPGALIDNVTLQHADSGELVELDDEAIIHTGIEIYHEFDAEGDDLEHDEEDDIVPFDVSDTGDEVEHAVGDAAAASGATDGGPTIQEIYDGMTTEEQQVVHYLVGEAMATSGSAAQSDDLEDEDNISHTDDKEPLKMSRNAFEGKQGSTTDRVAGQPEHVLSHDALNEIQADAARMGSAKRAFEAYALQHGIENMGVLFPDAQMVNGVDMDQRRTEWVMNVLGSVKKLPFSRIKSIVADLTHEQARAKGYIKGTFKREEWFALAKRVTTPATIYKKQQLDRDDIIDITDLDVVAWLKVEMRGMVDEEIARAILIGDGRAVDDPEKIKDPSAANEGAGIRSILNDHELYAPTINVPVDETDPKWPVLVIDEILDNMRFYKGSGNPTFYTTQPVLSKMLLVRDSDGKRLYRTPADVAAEIGCKDIVAVESMEDEINVIGIIVNLVDYSTGTDRGGDLTLFDDFDIDYNQYKYLLETRMSGALTKVRAALKILKVGPANALAVPERPGFVAATGVLTPKTTTGVTYKRADTNAVVTTGSPITLTAGQTLKIYAQANSGYYFETNQDDEFEFTRPAA